MQRGPGSQRGMTATILAVLLLLLPSSALPAEAGNLLLYPFARMFGSPSESELAKCRQAFRQWQARPPSCLVCVQPVLWVTPHRGGPTRSYRLDRANALVTRLEKLDRVRLVLALDPPTVAPDPFERNQLRYTWKRAATYAKYTAQLHPAESYVLFTEVWGAGANVAAIQIYLVDASGQIVYCRLFNSHQFGPNLHLKGPTWLDFLVPVLLRDMEREPEELFPKYGVG